MKNALLALFALICSYTALAQQNFTAPNPKNHSISFYAGFSVFETYQMFQSYKPNTYQSLNPDGPPCFMALSNLFSITYKYKKHEIIPVLYLRRYANDQDKMKTFVLGGSLSYLYHFSKKRTHLFFEANFQTYFYTTQVAYASITPYGSSQHSADWITMGWHAASIQNYVLNPAIGVEVKLWPLTYLQFAAGSGAFYMKGKSAIPANINTQWFSIDSFQNTYPGQFGLNWYARLSIIVRAFNF